MIFCLVLFANPVHCNKGLPARGNETCNGSFLQFKLMECWQNVAAKENIDWLQACTYQG
jgi:hypothetical protein